jgi:hypothetical protein
MPEDLSMPKGEIPGQKEYDEQLKAIQEAQRVYLEQSFKWLIDYIASYFPDDRLAIEDAITDVQFIHAVTENGKPLGALIYRFRKVMDKKVYFSEIEKDYLEGLEVPAIIFVDSETSKFEPVSNLQTGDNFIEIPPDKLTGRIRELREELKRKAKLKELKETL